jgi:hypothetical protein
MVVPDTTVTQARPVAVLTPKPPQRQRRPAKALAVVRPLRTAQPPRMSELTVVPAPTPTPRLPHPGTHGELHDVMGAVAGGARAFHKLPAGQSDGSNLLEVVGGLIGGAGGTRMSAGIGQAMPKEHNAITNGFAEKAEAHGADLAQQLRKLADEIDECAAAEAGPNGNGVARLCLLVFEGLVRIGAGVVNGAPAGARAHLTLVNPSEENVQRLVSNI